MLYLKLRLIIDKSGTHLHDCSKIIAQYLQPQAINEYTISNTLSFPNIFRENPLDSNEEYIYLMMWICYSPVFL